MRGVLLSGAATLTMAGLLLWLGLRALGELLGLRLPFLPAEAPAERPRQRPGIPDRTGRGELLIFFGGLAVLWAGTILAYLALDRGGKSVGDFFSLWTERFTTAGDAPHYLYLARCGYARSGEQVNLIVFYPLYPLLMGLLGRLLGGNYVLAGLLLSQAAYGAASVLFWRLAGESVKRPELALAAFWLYPQGFFALGIFTEGLFLFLSLGCLWALRRERWAAAGIWGFFCMLSRTQGMALWPAYLYAAWAAARRSGRRRGMLWGLALPAGWGIYLLCNRAAAGSFFAFRYYESISPWWQTTQWLGRTIAQQADMALAYPWLGKIIYWPQLILYFAAAALLFAALRNRVPTEQTVHGTAYLGMCYLASWLISGGRYLLGCTGLYLSVGALRRRWGAGAVLAAELLAGAWFYFNFMDGQSIM